MIKVDNICRVKILGTSAFLFALSVIMPASAISSPVFKLAGGEESYDISSYMEVAEDGNDEWKTEDLASREISSLFAPIKENDLYGKFSDSAIWVRFNLSATPPAATRKWFLTIHMPLLDNVEFYIPDDAGRYKVKRSGRSVPFYDKEVKSRNQVFEMPAIGGSAKTFYLRIKTESLLVIPVTVMSEEALFRTDHTGRLIGGIYCGVVLVMAFYNLFLFFSLKERPYLIYISHIICTGLYVLSLTGIGYEYLWPELTWWNQRADMFFAGFALFFAALFTKSFLTTEILLPGADLMLKLIMALSLLMGLSSLILRYSLSVQIMTVLAGIAVVTYELSGILAYRKGFRAARFFLLSWSFFLMIVFCLALTNLGLLPFSYIPNMVMMSSMVEITLMSFALADRINILRDENQIAQAQVIHSGQLASLGELAAGVGHEINNPLQCIMNYSSLIRRSLDEGDEKREYVDIVMGESRRIANIVSSLLNLSRPTNEDMVEVDVKTLVSEILVLSERQIKKDGIDINVDIPEDLPLVKGHFQQLEQIMLNFISNSRYALNNKVNFNEGEKRAITIAAENFNSRDGLFVRIKVSDNGVGMPSSIKSKVFTPFFTTKPPGSGTGLGLSINHEIINKHNGTMRIDSVEGEYCTAVIELPAIKG
ncbi:MAG: 7TM diverse intracellular signaling domain-containing protein [bacterium]|nr:7TM diverse intracellular signaling domain-containing protein [bacterium]